MRSRFFAAVVVAAASVACLAGAASAQGVIDPSNYSSQQSIDESLTTSGSSVTTVSRSDFSFLWRGMLWSQLAWVPASPLHSPSMLAVVNLGDRRWGLR